MNEATMNQAIQKLIDVGNKMDYEGSEKRTLQHIKNIIGPWLDWRRVEDELPKNLEMVMFVTTGHGMFYGRAIKSANNEGVDFHAMRFRNDFGTTTLYESQYVTHWTYIPMPEAEEPKRGQLPAKRPKPDRGT